MSQQHAPRRFGERWRLSRAGIVNIWHYLDNEFDLSGGRMILRGTNGSGKSRALEMLLPFLLDAERRRMDATGAARVSLDELMRSGDRNLDVDAGQAGQEAGRVAGGHLEPRRRAVSPGPQAEPFAEPPGADSGGRQHRPARPCPPVEPARLMQSG